MVRAKNVLNLIKARPDKSANADEKRHNDKAAPTYKKHHCLHHPHALWAVNVGRLSGLSRSCSNVADAFLGLGAIGASPMTVQ